MAVQATAVAPRVDEAIPTAAAAIVEAPAVTKAYDTGAVRVDALRGIDLSVAQDEMVAIMSALTMGCHGPWEEGAT